MTDRDFSEGRLKDFVCAHVWVSGTVQGVGYRFSTVDVARQLNLTGWVRNLSDGRVEAVFEGDRENVEAAIAWCRRGPSAAIVRDVRVVWDGSKGLSGFETRPTV